MPRIFEWKCSFYQKPDGKWFHGKLKLYQQTLRFKAQDDTSVSLNITDIVEIKRRTTNLFYNAIVITYVKKEQFWFSSFGDVYNTLGIIEHFWREPLLGGQHGVEGSNKQPARRNDLLEIAYESQNVLMSAAQTLHSQGDQIRSAATKMDMLQSDLRVAEHIVSDLDSWFGGWRVSKPINSTVSSRLESPLTSQRLEYSILVAKTAQESHTPSVLVLGTSTIEILCKKGKLLHSFRITELSYATVHSPYDMTFVRRSIGKPDIKVHVISTRLPFILTTFETVYKYKPIYEDLPTSSDGEKNGEKPRTEIGRVGNSYTENVVKPVFACYEARGAKKPTGDALLQTSATASSATGSTRMYQQMKSKEQNKLTDSEANELTSIIRNMKAMATDINCEQELQNEQIDRLAVSVQEADTKIRQDNRTIKKML